VGAKVYALRGRSGLRGYGFWCPGCADYHMFRTEPWKRVKFVDGVYVESDGFVWQFNGDVDCPTFSPALLVKGRDKKTGKRRTICHVFVRDGQLEYMDDAGHFLAGKTVEMEDEV